MRPKDPETGKGFRVFPIYELDEQCIYMERDFAVDDEFLVHVRQALIDNKQLSITVPESRHLNNCNKSVGGQLAIDLERILNHELADIDLPAVLQDQRGRRYLREASVDSRHFLLWELLLEQSGGG